MIEKILVANRGEIAVRIIRAVQASGLQSVAVYSEADRHMPFAKLADEAVCIGPAESAKSYLDMQIIIQTAKLCGADAIHPGYGFLAENVEFATACETAGLVFIGPGANVIATMGSKITAKKVAVEAGIPVIPGYYGTDQSDDNLQKSADATGYPLMIKASAGGGGRGIRVVQNADEFSENLSLARKEAQSAFGNSDILLERQIKNARHIEVQILGDATGKIVHLLDRDCSFQRNHQKVIEEAPAPNVPESIQAEMRAAAVRLCQKIGYSNAGTVEFLYEPLTEAFFFLEMNTRLQVEHPVTECITGIDIVQWQIRIASGESLPFDQKDIPCNGHAIEARVAAEDPVRNFMPATGIIEHYSAPSGPGIRIDSAVNAGNMISPYYDSMIAKVICHGDSRNAANSRLIRALSKYRIAGVTTNIPFLTYLLKSKAFKDASLHTGLIGSMDRNDWPVGVIENKHIGQAALYHFLSITSAIATNQNPWVSLTNWRITGQSGLSRFIVRSKDGEDTTVTISGRKGNYSLIIGDKVSMTVRQATVDGTGLRYEEAGRIVQVDVFSKLAKLFLFDEGGPLQLSVLRSEQALLQSRDSGALSKDSIVAPMAGLVSDILVIPGAQVAKGDILIEFEAMKMLQTLTAPVAGLVRDIAVQKGDTVGDKTVLITLEPDEEQAESNDK